jgi:hypothetical protein
MLDWLANGGELANAFRRAFAVEPQPFGNPALRIGGVSDGQQGVQWNLACDPGGDEVFLGVNLEGMKYGGWPIATLILSELNKPSLLDLQDHDSAEHPITIWLRRDYWQAASRPPIIQRNLGVTPIRLANLDEVSWNASLLEALECLDKEKSYRGRATQTVTFPSGRNVTGPVSPHLQIFVSEFAPSSLDRFISYARRPLEPFHKWATAASRTT